MNDYQDFSTGGSRDFEFPAQVSASCLAYLFADRFVRPLSRWSRALGQLALATPTSGTLVDIGPVQFHCLATALWSLEHHGLMTISEKVPTASNLLGRIGEHELRFERVSEGEDLVGLEGMVLSALPGKPVNARELLLLDPFEVGRVDLFLFPVQEEAVASSVVVPPEHEGRVPSSLRWSVYARYETPEIARTSLEAQFRSADEAGLFGRDQPQLFKRVRKRSPLGFKRLRRNGSSLT
jgi:hypothetical protein